MRISFIRQFLILLIIILALLNSNSPSIANTQSNPFEVTKGLETKFRFWMKVYSEYTTDQIIIHDSDDLGIIYDVVDFRGQKHLSKRQRSRKVQKVKKFYKNILRKLARNKKNSKLNQQEKQLYSMVKKSFWNASNNIRAQLGQKNRFRIGLQRSGYYIDEMRRIFREFGLPEELTVLPHVESSFNIAAYSKSGAAGMWQFMRSTGKRFLKINYAVDERRDPILSTIAAAKLLKGNYEELGKWPLAITAYNHGLNGMKRAKRKLGSDDIVDVINDYDGRRFGFASENFYTQFLAALETSRNHNKFFPGLEFYKPIQTDKFRLPNFVNISTLSKYLNMSVKEIVSYNRSLRPPVRRSEQYIPRGFILRVPKDHIADLRLAYARIPESKKYSSQKRTNWYKVRRGDTLIRIARRFRTSVRTLINLNQLSRSGRIYARQVLQLPGSNGVRTASLPFRQAIRKYKNKDTVFSGRYKKIVVRKNDTLESISIKYGVDIRTIMKNNNIKNPHRIYVGRVLKIPEMIDKKDRIKLAKLEKPKVKNTERTEVKPIKKIEPAEVELKSIINDEVGISSRLLPVSVKEDPKSKYLVGFIFAEVDETIGHYAEWGGVSARFIRKVNGFRYGRNIHLNQKIKIPFFRVTPDIFFQKRREYHKSIQEDFFENYKIKETDSYFVKSGVTVWQICNKIYDIPLWLLRKYNPKTDLENLKRGENLVVPIVSKI